MLTIVAGFDAMTLETQENVRLIRDFFPVGGDIPPGGREETFLPVGVDISPGGRRHFSRWEETSLQVGGRRHLSRWEETSFPVGGGDKFRHICTPTARTVLPTGKVTRNCVAYRAL